MTGTIHCACGNVYRGSARYVKERGHVVATPACPKCNNDRPRRVQGDPERTVIRGGD